MVESALEKLRKAHRNLEIAKVQQVKKEVVVQNAPAVNVSSRVGYAIIIKADQLKQGLWFFDERKDCLFDINGFKLVSNATHNSENGFKQK